MLEKLFDLGGHVTRHVGHLDRNQWLLVMACVVVVGLFCFRGFGSRTDY